MKNKIIIADFIISYLEKIGVGHVFVVSGGGNVSLIDAIARSKKIKYVCNHHEQAAAMAAESYGRVSGNIGVCMVTSGPGSTNTVTGVACAWLDSIPTLYISGQVKRDNMVQDRALRQLGVQEVNIIDIVKPITKYAVVVMNPEDIKYYLKKAVFLAKNGRPGPVFLDIPSDVLNTKIDEKLLRDFNPNAEKLEIPKDVDLQKKIQNTIALLKQAKRPIIFAGHGIHLSKATKEFLQLVEKLQIPVVTTMSAHDLIPTAHTLYVGRPGIFGDRAGNFAIQNADVLVSIGARHHLWNIGYNYQAFAREAKKIIVDIDKAELEKKTVIPDIAIQADAKEFITELNKQVKDIHFPQNKGWKVKCLFWKKKYPVVLPEYKNQKRYINSYYFIDVLSSLLKEGETIVTGVGTSFTGTLQSIKLKKGQHLHCNVGCASMGYDLPAAIGAAFAARAKRIVLIVGEGSIMLNIQELQTIYHYKLPIKIFLLNNNGYLAIKNTQNSFFQGNLNAVDEKSGLSFPDFKKVADAFGIYYEKIHSHRDIKKKVNKTLNFRGAVICEVPMDPNQTLFPKVYSQKNADGSMESKPLEDMYPFLNRKEFLSNMFIKPI